MENLGPIFESVMIICFGVSWPLSVIKSWKSRTAKGKSLVFLLAILVGYLSGIAGKIITGNITYVIAFYIFNVVMVTADICLYFRNRKLDAARAAEAK